jgi:hypothetical protein
MEQKVAKDAVVREGDGVSVKCSKWAATVFENTHGHYTVAGYGERGKHSFGQIYLYLDKGTEYDRQSTPINAALMALGADESFHLALDETRRYIASHPETPAQPAKHIADISTRVLAAICTLWFDLPDGINVVEGGLKLDGDVEPPRCPGHYAPPSAYTFKPDPDERIVRAGQLFGKILRRAVSTWLAALRQTGAQPAGRISRVAFDAFPGDDDLIVRTIIGVMMGMLPTIDNNLKNVVTHMPPETFAALRDALQAHAGTDAFQRASDVLLGDLMRGMQARPVPDAVWRTAVQHHDLAGVPVTAGDTIRVYIDAATQADLAAGVPGVFTVFGGDRRATPQPQHACPAYRAAMGIMLGVLNGLLEPTP